jgi:integrase
VFAAQDGRPIWPGFVSDRFHTLTDLTDLPSIRLHDLRHSAASLALAAGVDLKTVSSNLGHAGISITADRYSHVLPAVARAAAERVAALVDESTM